MDERTIAQQIQEVRGRIAALGRRAMEPRLPFDLLPEALKELQTALEELQVAEEELRLQAETTLRYVTGHARCLLWHAVVEARADRPGAYRWKLHHVDEDAAQRFLPLEVRPGERYNDAWKRSKLPEDRQRMDENCAASLCSGSGGYEQEFRCRRADGELRWLSEHVHVEPLGPARWRLVGVCTDVTERKRAEEERVHATARERRLEADLEHERTIVQTLAGSFLGKPPTMPGLQVATRYQPASRSDRVGGDTFDFLVLENRRIGVVIGDVCGSGLAAALYAGTTKSMLRAYALEEPEPRIVLHRLNQALYREMCEDARFVSLLYGILDPDADTFTYANAGHPPPVCYDPTSRQCERLPVTGIIAGAFPDMRFQQRSVALPPGATLVLFTDGVVEAAGACDPFDDGGIGSLLASCHGESAEAIARAICEQLTLQAGRELTDDVTLVVIRRA